MFVNFSEFPTFGAKQFEAFTGSSVSAFSGAQKLYSESADYLNKCAKNNIDHMSKLVGAKPEEALKLQSEFAKTAFEDFVSASTKIANLYATTMTAGTPTFGAKSGESSKV